MKYILTFIGEFVCNYNMRCGLSTCMKQNPYNAIMHVGHAAGTVSLWSPTQSSPLVKMLCHKGGISSLSVKRDGYYMATSGADGLCKIWDIRTYKQVSVFKKLPCSDLDYSQTGLLACCCGTSVNIYKNVERDNQLYMTHNTINNTIVDFHFRPYEDIGIIGHSNGVSSIVIPGSGEANFDTFESNPYQTQKQRREDTIHKLLEKIPADMICLDPNSIGKVRDDDENISEESDQENIKIKKKKIRPKYK